MPPRRGPEEERENSQRSFVGDEGGWDRRGGNDLGDGGGYRVRGGPIGGGRDML